jgi:non-ribosomal peptide synthetase component F
MARRRPPTRSFAGAEIRFDVPSESTDALRELAASNNTTLYVVLLSAFHLLLHRYTGADDVVVGSPVQGRPRAEFANLVGCFFNAAVLRSDFSEDRSFGELLADTRQKVIAALERQHYPSHLIAEKLGLARDPSRPSLFSVSFILQKPVFAGTEFDAGANLSASFGKLKVELAPVARQYSRNDLEMEILEASDGLAGIIQYNTELFDPADITRMCEHYTRLLVSAAENPSARTSRLSMTSESEQALLFGSWSRSPKVYPEATTISELFTAQVARSPEQIAASHRGAALTYAQLDADAERLSDLIRELSSNAQVSR